MGERERQKGAESKKKADGSFDGLFSLSAKELAESKRLGQQEEAARSAFRKRLFEAILPSPTTVQGFREELFKAVSKAIEKELEKAAKLVTSGLKEAARKGECEFSCGFIGADESPLKRGKFGVIGEVMYKLRTKLQNKPVWMKNCGSSEFYTFFDLSGVDSKALLDSVTDKILSNQQQGWKERAKTLVCEIEKRHPQDPSSALTAAEAGRISPEISIKEATKIIFGESLVIETDMEIPLTLFPYLAEALRKKGLEAQVCYTRYDHSYMNQVDGWELDVTEYGNLLVKW
jgi:hypothetical protein